MQSSNLIQQWSHIIRRMYLCVSSQRQITADKREIKDFPEFAYWRTNQTMNIVGVHGQSRTLELGVAGVYFPSLNNVGGRFPVAVSDINQKQPIIGMDIMTPLGISIDTQPPQLSIRNESWEAFKTLAGVGVLVFAGIKILDSIFEEK